MSENTEEKKFLVVKLLVNTGAKPAGIYDMLCCPVRDPQPAQRRVRMLEADAIKYAIEGKVQMLSPGWVQQVEEEKNKKPVKAKAKTIRTKPGEEPEELKV